MNKEYPKPTQREDEIFDEVMKYYNKEWNPFWKNILDKDSRLLNEYVETFNNSNCW